MSTKIKLTTNRDEIACWVIKSTKLMAVKKVSVYSDANRHGNLPL